MLQEERATKELEALQGEKHSLEGRLKSAEEENARVSGECKGLQAKPETRNSKETINPQTSTLNPQSSTLNPQPSYLSPKPQTLNQNP